MSSEVEKIKSSLGSEMTQIQQLLKKQEEDMKSEMEKLIKITQESEAERLKAVQEIRQLKENFERQKREQSDLEWEHISRTLHWRNTIDQLDQLSPQKSGIKLKTILTGGYYGDADYALMQKIKQKQQNLRMAPTAKLDETIYENMGPVSGQPAKP